MNISELKNTVIQGDCLEVMKQLPDKCIDMILCDLPYWTTACKRDTIIPFEPLWEQYKRIIKPNGAIVLFGSEPFSSALRMSNIKQYKYDWIWDKDRSSGSMLAKRRPLKYHEIISVFSKWTENYYPQMTKWKMMKKASGGKSDNYWNIPIVRYENDEYYPRSIQTFKWCHNMQWKVHPTQKPVALFEYLIKTYTNEWDIVLDNCAGSWTTAIACINTKRNYILIEQEQEYIDVINKRIAKHNIPLL